MDDRAGLGWIALELQKAKILVVMVFCLFFLSGPIPCLASENPLHRALRARTSLLWEGVCLRSGLERLTGTYQVTIFLDRRVDPDQQVTFAANNIPLDELLHEIAAERNLAVSYIGTVIYLGPPQAARILKTIAELCRDDLPSYSLQVRKSMQVEQSIEWPALTVPREWLSDLEKSRDMQFVGLGRIPHDLWPPGKLPPMPLTDQLTLFLIGFDIKLSPTSNGRALELVPITGKERLTRRYDRLAGRAVPLDRIQQIAPDAIVSYEGRSMIVRGLAEEHEQIVAAMHGPAIGINQPRQPQRKPAQQEQTQYTIRVTEKPIGPVLSQLALTLGLQVEFEETAIQDAGISLSQPISFSVKQASLTELLNAAVAPAGLTYELDGKTLRIVPARPN
ncbi:MAG: STN domain-containing protein [Pirellulales bacterium]|nr:STN domain-containing protein [Pirellulales bacterium]